MVQYRPISAKGESRLHHFGKKVLPGIFLGYAVFAGRKWKKGDILVADIEELGNLEASEIHDRRLNAKEIRTPRRWQCKIVGKRLWSPKINSGAGTTCKKWSSQRRTSRKLGKDSTRVQLYVPKKGTFPIPLKYIDVTRTTHTNLDVFQESRVDDYWNVDVDRNLSDSWSGITKFTSLNGAIEQRRLDNARRLRGIWFIDPEDGECKETIKQTQGKSSRYQMEAAVPWKMGTKKCSKKSRETDDEVKGSNNIQRKKQSMHASWRHTNPRERFWNLLCQKITKVTLRKRGSIPQVTVIWCTSLFQCFKRWKVWMRKLQSTKNGRSSKSCQRGNCPRWRAKRRSLRKHRERKRKSTLLHWWHPSSQ